MNTPRVPRRVALAFVLGFVSFVPLQGQVVNIAPEGQGLLGYIDDDDYTQPGIELYHAPAPNNAAGTNINDDINTSRVDTFNSRTTGSSSFVGILWLGGPRAEKIKTLELTLATFFDGGWFGVNGSGPGAGGMLTAAHLAEPEVQITTDAGSTWTTVPHTSNYLALMTGHQIGGGSAPNPTSKTTLFTLATPIANVDGVRIVGRDGGQADVGFLGVFELRVFTLPANDLDDDGMADDWEDLNGLNKTVNDAALDKDVDGLSNLAEFELGTDPQNVDTDGDGLLDGPEVHTHLTNPKLADTDGDGLSDGDEVNIHHSNPLVIDTDGDGLTDGQEVNIYHTSPILRDSDEDGFSDGVEVRLGSNPTLASSMPENIAPAGTAIFGTNPAIDSTLGTPRANAGITANINDTNFTTRVDNYGSADPFSYVGVLWTAPRTQPVAEVRFAASVFFDGGWFGPQGASPGSGGFLSAPDYLIEPTVQVTTDGGVTWTDVPHHSNYLTLFNGHPLPRADFGAPTSAEAVFVLDTPQAGINGIRLIGENGGSVDSGFLGVFEFGVRELPAVIANPNLAHAGSAIVGTHFMVDGGFDTDMGLLGSNAGFPTYINDLSLQTRVDTYAVSSSDEGSFVGILWPTARPEAITSLTYTGAVFYDGGWFGPNFALPAPDSPLLAEHLEEPTVQVTTDGGFTWETVAHTSNYLEAFTDQLIPATGGAPKSIAATFALATPRTGLNGIRLIGQNGGTADGNGFLGVFDVSVAGISPTADSDGDGQNNAAEAIAGTDPNDATSYLRLLSVSPSGVEVTLTWSSVPGKNYRIESSNTLTGWSSAGRPVVPAAASPATTTSATLPAAAGPQFYRIAVTTAP